MKWDCKPAKYCRIWKNKNTQIKCEYKVIYVVFFLAFNKSILVVIKHFSRLEARRILKTVIDNIETN